MTTAQQLAILQQQQQQQRRAPAETDDNAPTSAVRWALLGSASRASPHRHYRRPGRRRRTRQIMRAQVAVSDVLAGLEQGSMTGRSARPAHPQL